jgi:hypothetical protein
MAGEITPRWTSLRQDISPILIAPPAWKQNPLLKPPTPLRDTRDAEDPFLIGQELVSQGCDWPTEYSPEF